jgi:hypothetical protein
MKRSAFLALAALLLPAAAQAETTWSGGTSWRHLIRINDDGLSTKNAAGKDSSKSTVKAHQFRADLNAFTKGEDFDWGVGFRTYDRANSEWLSLQNNSDLAITLENAFLRAHYAYWGLNLDVTLGRAKTVIFYDSIGQALFDKDNRWDGLGWAWTSGAFGLNASQYILGARSGSTALGSSSFTRTDATESVSSTPSGFGMLYSIQPHVKFKVSDEIEAIVAVGYHHWAGVGGTSTYENAVHGGTAGTVGNTLPVILDNPRQWQLMTEWTLPMKLRFVGEYIQNKKVLYGPRGVSTNKEAQNGALSLALAYGKVKKANDFSLSYAYVRKGIASSINTFSNSNMNADNLGHLIEGKYALADGFTLTTKVELYREKAKLGGDGLALTAPNQNRRQTQNRYEFVAGASF